VERLRESIEEFARRYWHEENRVVRMLVVAAVLVAVCVSLASYSQTPKYEASARVLVGRKQGEYWANLGVAARRCKRLSTGNCLPRR
jgi:capsular polysaccharide biosynthesis protein